MQGKRYALGLLAGLLLLLALLWGCNLVFQRWDNRDRSREGPGYQALQEQRRAVVTVLRRAGSIAGNMPDSWRIASR